MKIFNTVPFKFSSKYDKDNKPCNLKFSIKEYQGASDWFRETFTLTLKCTTHHDEVSNDLYDLDCLDMVATGLFLNFILGKGNPG